MLVRAQGIATTGERYQLTCSVTKNSRDTISITWIDSLGSVISNGSGISLGLQIVNGTASVSTLVFDTLMVGHEGNYTCQLTGIKV